MTTLEQVQDYCSNNSITFTRDQENEAVDLVDNSGYTVEQAVNATGHPEKPTGGLQG